MAATLGNYPGRFRIIPGARSGTGAGRAVAGEATAATRVSSVPAPCPDHWCVPDSAADAASSVSRMSWESDLAPSFFITAARWFSTVR
jgi:hypothetical protein